MNEIHIQKIAGELKVQPRQVVATTRLFAAVTEVDLPRKRIALSMKAAPQIGPGVSARPAGHGSRSAGNGANRPSHNAKPPPVDWLTDALNKNPKR